MHTRYVKVAIGHSDYTELFMNRWTKALIYRALLEGQHVTIQFDHGFTRTLTNPDQVIW